MSYYREEQLRYDIVIAKGRYFSLAVDDDEMAVAWQFAGSIENSQTQTDLIVLNVDTSQMAVDRITFFLLSTETTPLTESNDYIYDIKYKKTADATTDWEPYMWGCAYVQKTVTP